MDAGSECLFILARHLHGVVGLGDGPGPQLPGLENFKFAFCFDYRPAVVAFVDVGRLAVGVEPDAGDFFILGEHLVDMVLVMTPDLGGDAFNFLRTVGIGPFDDDRHDEAALIAE